MQRSLLKKLIRTIRNEYLRIIFVASLGLAVFVALGAVTLSGHGLY